MDSHICSSHCSSLLFSLSLSSLSLSLSLYFALSSSRHRNNTDRRKKLGTHQHQLIRQLDCSPPVQSNSPLGRLSCPAPNEIGCPSLAPRSVGFLAWHLTRFVRQRLRKTSSPRRGYKVSRGTSVDHRHLVHCPKTATRAIEVPMVLQGLSHDPGVPKFLFLRPVHCD